MLLRDALLAVGASVVSLAFQRGVKKNTLENYFISDDDQLSRD